MHRLGLALILVASTVATVACERGQTAPDTATPSDSPPPQPSPEPESEPASEEPESEEPEPEPAGEAEVSQFVAEDFTEGGFSARNIRCEFEEASSVATGYIKASLVDADAALDACSSKGTALQVSWKYIGGPTSDISVDADNQKTANCVANAIAKHVSAGVRASCTAVLLIGDSAGAAASFESRYGK
jgi:hypothetical protein